MQNIIRAALPGYNALTDTNLDHFSLVGDSDNVLIKKFLTGAQTVNAGLTPTFAHNLGYIPFFTMYADEFNNGIWKVVNNQYNLFSLPDMQVAADTSNLYFYNNDGNNIPIAYDIFYDNMNDNTAPAISNAGNTIRIARPGKNVGSTNPNDFILHSSLNNFKILKQGVISGYNTSSASFLHGANVQTPYKFFVFVKFPDGKVACIGNAACFSYDATKAILCNGMDSTKIYLSSTFATGDFTCDVYYLIYGTGKANTLAETYPLIKVAASGKNALTENNPDNFNFHSNYPTLKYFQSGNWNMGSITTTTIKTIPHNLGYTPFFVAFVKDLSGTISNAYATVPYFFGRNSIPLPNRSVAAYAYADSTNLYLVAYYQTNAIGTTFSYNWYYKIFKNNTGL